MEYQPNPKHIHGAGGLISFVQPESIAAELALQPGDIVQAVNGLRLRDEIDYRFASAEEELELLVQHASGESVIYEIEKDPDEDLGIAFGEPLFDRLRTCNNKCPFCFLTQMPKGMRKTLYLKDDDYRLSFLYGNFVTLTNLDEQDWQRIEEQHLSPLHISVHATDRALRAVLLGKQDVPDVLAQIARLGRAGIDVHTQIVACPGLNDGAALHQSIRQLAACSPTVQSIAVVPVGLTRFRFQGKAPQSVRTAIQVHETPEWIDSNHERQPLWMEGTTEPAGTSTDQPDPAADWGFCARLGAATDIPLRCYTPAEAAAIIDMVEPYSQHYRQQHGSALVYPSDEFYLLCQRPLPPATFYDDYPQYSNGVGMTREFLDAWQQAQQHLPERLAQPVTMGLVCGTLMRDILQQIVARLRQVAGLDMRLLPVVNQFFGETVTVSGLLTAGDVIPTLRASGCQHALLPGVMFDYQGIRTLDEYSPARIAEESGVSISIITEPDELVQYIQKLSHATADQAPMGNTTDAARLPAEAAASSAA